MNHLRRLVKNCPGGSTELFYSGDNSLGHIQQAKFTRRVMWDTAPDPMYNYLANLRPKKLVVLQPENNILLEILVNNSLLDYLSEADMQNLSKVNIFFWNCCAQHYEIAFPPNEDLPREPKTAFDTYYIESESGTIHRLTLTRSLDDNIVAAILNGELLYINRQPGVHLLFPHSQITNVQWPGAVKAFWYRKIGFTIDNIKFLIHKKDKITSIYYGYYPKEYHVYVNDYRTLDGEKFQKANRRISIFIFALIWIFTLAVFGLVIVPMFILYVCVFELLCNSCLSVKKGEYRKYWVSHGATMHRKIEEKKIMNLSPKVVITEPSEMV